MHVYFLPIFVLSFPQQRDIYYEDPSVYGSQSCLDELVDNISCMLRVPRHLLHVVSLHYSVSHIHRTDRDLLVEFSGVQIENNIREATKTLLVCIS